ncbi:protein unc-93 homolog A [Patella vulgata]|uniref:protein unc-93 homolog A n=1 Tax=Patella vulgata TaxID=6465 RepID=UPI00218058C3|nr:protein unc-93 homolog A [Patella vulgata]XP_050399301.1 protein unc-93 homolog A [Patella vulgata]
MTDKEKYEMNFPTKEANGHAAEPFTCQMSKFQILKNLFVVSFGFVFLFTAFQSMANLQSSLNKEEGVGTASLSTLYGALVVSCMFVPPILIAHLGCKWTIPLSMCGYVLYMGANFYAVWGTMIPAAIILGLGAAPLWSAKCAYLTETGIWYAKLTGQSEDATINRFFGIFFMIFQTSQIWGNLISSTVFSPTPENGTTLNVTNDLNKCGANFDPIDPPANNTNLKKPEQNQVYLLCGIYIGCAVAAVIIISVLLDKIILEKDERRQGRPSPKLLIATFKHLISSPAQLLLIPLTIYSGVEQAFISGDYTKSYITCSLGIWNVGYVMICYGVVDAICSFSFGRMVQYVGHIPFFILAFIVHGGVQITLLFWIPDPDAIVIFYVLAALWGMGDAVIQTQINAFYGFLFKDNTEPAFANYRLWESVGFIFAYAYNDFIVTNIKIYVCMAFLVVGMAGYGTVEVMQRTRSARSADITK